MSSSGYSRTTRSYVGKHNFRRAATLNFIETTTSHLARILNAKLIGDAHAVVQDVTHDSRKVEAGWAFVAVEGATRDAHEFVAKAVTRGAVAIISERLPPAGIGCAWLQVADARSALAHAAAEVHHHPSRELQLVGITGTNGKTTIAYLVYSILEAARIPAALLSTIEYRLPNLTLPAERTTPEASTTNRLLRQAIYGGAQVGVMECSSQALDLRRCDYLQMSVAVWTNLTPDHLDYHRTMEAYLEAKMRLFDGSTGTRPRHSVVNSDDKAGIEVLKRLRAASLPAVTYALDDGADFTARRIENFLGGARFEIVTPVGTRHVATPLIGRPHIYNILAATATVLHLGIDLDTITSALAYATGAPGRFELIAHDGDYSVAVDYAHTEDALANTLRAARAVTKGRIIIVFGCGGDRDRTKRRPMGERAATLSDIVILTSDNPRGEDPEKILAEIEIGLQATGKPYRKISDRRTAIYEAIDAAQTGDLVIIAGKGHEDYQIIGNVALPFSDREVARAALRERAPRK